MVDDENAKPQQQENPQDSGTRPDERPPSDPDLSDYYKREPSLQNVEKR